MGANYLSSIDSHIFVIFLMETVFKIYFTPKQSAYECYYKGFFYLAGGRHRILISQ